MSFLEMLDVLNERLILDGEDPVAFDHDCREGICGMCSMVINGVRARPGAGHHDLPAAHAALHRRRHDRQSSRGGPPRSRSSRTWSSTAAPSTGSSRPAATSPRRPAPRPTRTPPRCPSRRRRAPSTRPPASAAAPAWRPARTARRCCSPPRRSPTWAELPQGQPERDTRVLDMVDPARRRGLRRLHQHRRVHRRLPQGHPADVIGRLNRDYLMATAGGRRRHVA